MSLGLQTQVYALLRMRSTVAFLLLGGCYPWVDGELHASNNKPCSVESVWYRDADGDGFGVEDETKRSCVVPKGYTAQIGDCGPDDPDTYPGAPDAYGDGVNQDCDPCDNGAGDGVDADCDFYPSNDELAGQDVYDCNSTDGTVNPGVAEVPNDGFDNDCNGEDAIDADGDGHTAGVADCDDDEPTTFLGAPELPDCVDNDCDTLVDEGLGTADTDGDGYCVGFDDGSGLACCPGQGLPGDCDDTDPAQNLDDDDVDGFSSCAGDCDDKNGDRYPGNTEICDGLDNDCLGLPTDEADADNDGSPICSGDCDDDDPTIGPFDADGDGFTGCGATPDCDDTDDTLTPEDNDNDGSSTCTGDCDDANATLEGLDVDNDGFSTCDGDCDDTNAVLNLADADLDTYTSCEGDCDDSDDGAYPADLDGDGHGACSGDCNDADEAINPEAIDDCDGIDNDCDDVVDGPGLVDSDGDGFTICDGDCNNREPSIHPGAVEVCDGEDSDCDGDTPPTEVDSDFDGTADCADCADLDATRHLDALEQCNGVDDDCDGVIDDDCVTCDIVVPTDQPTIQDAIDVATTGQIVCVEPGEWRQNLQFRGVDIHLVGIDGPATTLITAFSPGSLLRIDQGESAAMVVEGFTIMFGTDTDGGGVHIAGPDTSPTLRRLVITNNHAFNKGGGVYIGSGSVLLDAVEIRGNTADSGAGLFVGDPAFSVELRDSRVSDNLAEGMGGGVELGGVGDLVMLRSEFLGNAAGCGGALKAAGSGGSVVGTDLLVAGTVADAAFWMGSGSLDLDGVEFTGNNSSSHTLYLQEVAVDLDDVTIASNIGGGMLVDGGSLEMSHSRVVANTAAAVMGGGLSILGGPATLSSVTLTDNETDGDGGGMYILEALQGVVLENVRIAGNKATNGGGIFLPGMCDHVTIDGLTVVGNEASAQGGGLFLGAAFCAEVTGFDAVFAGNRANTGAALWMATGDPVTTPPVSFSNTIVSDNVSDTDGAIRVDADVLELRYSNVWDNQPANFSGMADPTGTTGNLSVDPAFVDVSSPEPLDWDLHLATSSPLVDAGDPAITDPDASPSDMGAYGGLVADLWDLDGDGYFEWWEPGPWANAPWDCDDSDPTVFPGSGC